MSENMAYDQNGQLIDSFEQHLSGIFSRMGISLAITAATAYGVYLSVLHGTALGDLFMNPVSLIVILIIQLGVALGFRRAMFNFSATFCNTLLYVYAFITGITFSSIFLTYDIGLVFTAFLFSSVLFISCAIIGKTTNVDLSQFRGLLFGATIALLAVTILSLFIPILRDNMLISYAGVIIFLLYTAYDIQRIKVNYELYRYNDEIRDKFASYGAFELYLDFINLFLRILQILANSRSRRK